MGWVIAFLKDERAATAIEYGLIATGIAVAIIPVLTGVGSGVADLAADPVSHLGERALVHLPRLVPSRHRHRPAAPG
jgi:pilus assembly protein Flp/PilA